jgi:hypothetical protein
MTELTTRPYNAPTALTTTPPVGNLTPPPTPAATPLGYFQRALPVNVILGSFFVLTLPFAALILFAPSGLLMWGYLWLFGMTHFVVTLAIYLQSENVRHFAATWRNRLLFFAVPVAIFVGFDLLHAFRVGTRFPLFALYFWGAIRLLDFNHFNRQTFGVYQMFKGRTGVRFPLWLKRMENWYFAGLTGLLFTTFLAGGLFPLLQPAGWLTIWDAGAGPDRAALPLDILQTASVIGLLATGGLLTAVLVGIVRTWSLAGRPAGLGHALLYLAFQTISSLLAVVSFPLYMAALAIHYIEYHVLMIPRCFHTQLDERSRLDRWYGKLRSHRGLFYVAVLAVAALVTACSIAGMGVMGRSSAASLTKPFDYLVLIAVFDGLFVFHYFIEMLIWRFSDPYFRRTLAGLYFAPKVK